MTPKSKPTSSSKAKSKEISKNDKLGQFLNLSPMWQLLTASYEIAFSMKKKKKQQLLKGRKPGRDLKNVTASPRADKENSG